MPGETPAARVEETLRRVAEALDLGGDVEIAETASEIHAEFVGGDVAAVIGHHGATIDAIQQLAYRIAFHGEGSRKPVVVDAAGYRERRAQGLRAVADQAAASAVQEGRKVPLEPMGPQERKIVHEHLKERFDVETYSEGQEPSRRLVVAPLVD